LEAHRVEHRGEFITLFLKHQADLKAFIGSLVRDRHARDDVLQEVALTLWQRFSTYEPQRSFGAWARGIAAKKILQRWEKLDRMPQPFAPQVIQALLDAYERTAAAAPARSDALERCLQDLPDKSRRLLELRYEQALTLGEIARRVGSTLDAVHKALSRLRTRLQECVEQRLAAAGERLS
jgi:RNA polymerase sigma-70 factor (ECF subfamily)